jgi:hypothetical protein
MDWSKIEDGPKGQWEDYLGDLAKASRVNLTTGKVDQTVILLNENFK